MSQANQQGQQGFGQFRAPQRPMPHFGYGPGAQQNQQAWMRSQQSPGQQAGGLWGQGANYPNPWGDGQGGHGGMNPQAGMTQGPASLGPQYGGYAGYSSPPAMPHWAQSGSFGAGQGGGGQQSPWNMMSTGTVYGPGQGGPGGQANPMNWERGGPMGGGGGLGHTMPPGWQQQAQQTPWGGSGDPQAMIQQLMAQMGGGGMPPGWGGMSPWGRY